MKLIIAAGNTHTPLHHSELGFHADTRLGNVLEGYF